jgi:CrcB protein
VSAAAWSAFLVAAALGAIARALVDGWVTRRTDGPFPWATLVVNLSGSFVLGVITGLALYHGLSGVTRTVLGTGAMGAYTTFSTFSLETVRLAEEGAGAAAVRNVATSFLLGLAAASAGIGLAALV